MRKKIEKRYEGAEFELLPAKKKPKQVWFAGPPPSIGWWPTETLDAVRAHWKKTPQNADLRYWDGEKWGHGVQRCMRRGMHDRYINAQAARTSAATHRMAWAERDWEPK